MIMRNSFTVSILVLALLAVIVLSSGCGFFSHPGKTAAEVHRDQVRTIKMNHQELMADIDRAVFLDHPSRLTDKRIP
jgi:predicted small metal-binding protein